MSTVEIVKSFRTETAHIVRDAFSKRCAFSFHGHSYLWEVGIEGPVQEDGMVIDFGRLSEIKKFIDIMDHASILWEKESEEIKKFFLKNFVRVLIMKKNITAENMVRLVHKFVTEWLVTTGIDDIHVTYVKAWETVTGSAITKEHDEDDVFTLIHKDT